MTHLFRLFYSKTLFLAYGVSLFISFLMGLANVYSGRQQSVDLSFALFLFSIILYFILFFVLESNRIYQFFRTSDFRLLPISTRKLYRCNLLFSGIVGIVFFIGTFLVSVIMNYTIINIPFQIGITWSGIIVAAIDIFVLFLIVQFLVYLSSTAKYFVQKRYRWILEIVLFIVFWILFEWLLSFGFDLLEGNMLHYFGLKDNVYSKVIVQLISACIYFNLSIWVIDRYMEVGDR